MVGDNFHDDVVHWETRWRSTEIHQRVSLESPFRISVFFLFFPDRETRRDRSANVICFQLDWKEHNQLLCVFDTSKINLVSFGGGFAVRYLSLFLFFYFSCWVFIFFAVLETHGRHGRKAVRSAPTEFQLVTEKRSARVCLFSSNKTSSIFSSRDSYL